MSTHWVKRPLEGGGLDHLGVQAVSVSIYQQLLPGLTNVTERVACYSFYPWFVWAFDQESPKKDAGSFVEAFRRAECLVGLVSALHGIEDGDMSVHGGGLAGNLKLEPAARSVNDGGSVRLSTFATTDEAENRYFKNRLGGLGQYYLGPLKELLILDGDANAGVRYTDQRGVRLAAALDARVDRSRFFQALKSDRVDRTVLQSLSEFCPCRLGNNDSERRTLKTLLFNVPGSEFHVAEHLARSESLALLLDYCGTLPAAGVAGGFPELSRLLPVAAYAGVTNDGRPWKPEKELEAVRRRWAAYQRHEFLSVALQTLFWAGLTELMDSDVSLPDSAAYGKWMSERLTSRSDGKFWKTTVGDALRETSEHLPPLMACSHPGHELEMARAMMAEPGEEKAARAELAMRSLQLLLAIEARSSAAASYADVFFPADYFSSYELNLFSLRAMMRGQWAALPLKEWLRWLACHWGIRAHTRIALRKLRDDSRDTFRVIPSDRGLRVVEPPVPGWTSPRLRQAARALFDLRLISNTGCLTAEGIRIGEFRGRGD